MVLRWQRFKRLTDARSMFKKKACIYVQTDRSGAPIRVGKASKGLDARYRGGTGYALDAAMHGSRNSVYVTEVPITQCDLIERFLIWKLRSVLKYNNQGLKRAPTASVRLLHRGTPPRLPE